MEATNYLYTNWDDPPSTLTQTNSSPHENVKGQASRLPLPDKAFFRPKTKLQ